MNFRLLALSGDAEKELQTAGISSFQRTINKAENKMKDIPRLKNVGLLERNLNKAQVIKEANRALALQAGGQRKVDENTTPAKITKLDTSSALG